SFYNGELGTPYPLPGEKTKTGIKTHSSLNGASSDFNEVRFDDKKGSEEIYCHAQKDKNVRIKDTRKEWIGKGSHFILEEGHVFEQLKKGDQHVTLDKGDRKEKLTDGTLSLDISGDLHGKIGKNLAYDAGTEIHLKAGSTLVLESGTTLSLKVGGNFITIDSSGVAIKGSMA